MNSLRTGFSACMPSASSPGSDTGVPATPAGHRWNAFLPAKNRGMPPTEAGLAAGGRLARVRAVAVATGLLLLGQPGPARPLAAQESPAQPVRVVATLPVYAWVAREIGGTRVEATSIADPREDAHFVRPKPSFARNLRRADLFITTGLDLELWVPALLDKAGNADVLEGGKGYVAAYAGIQLLDIPSSADRSAGDLHVFGNPHLYTDPLRLLQIARNVTAGLKRVAPGDAAAFDQGLAGLEGRIHAALFGEELVTLLGGDALEGMALGGTLFSFLESNSFEGRPLLERLGGWLKKAEPFRGKAMICYHKNWAYFEERFQVKCAAYVEAKPGIPPTPGHVAELLDLMRTQGLGVLLAADYFDRRKVESVAERGGARAVIVPMQPDAGSSVPDYFALVDRWVQDLATAFQGGRP